MLLLLINEGVLISDLTSMTNIGLDEDVAEVLNDGLVGAALNDNNTPRSKWLGIWQEEFLSTKIPTTCSTWIDLGTAELDLGVLQESSIGLE